MNIKIVPFEPKYTSTFKEINVAWLEKYFYVEPKDKQLLGNCKEVIIDAGGFIFFALVDNKVAGCFALIKIDDYTFELGKMAVSDAYQGVKIGQLMIQFCIDFARQQHWKKILLYSNTKLSNAIYIYRKYGFVEVPLEQNLPYARSDIKMELAIT